MENEFETTFTSETVWLVLVQQAKDVQFNKYCFR